MASLQSPDQAGATRSQFRSGGASRPQGLAAAAIAEGTVLDVNVDRYTVDVVSSFDRKKWFGIQVGSPYFNHTDGTGQWACPEVGAKCQVVLPSDGTQPFIGWFLASPTATESKTVTNDDGTVDAADPDGTEASKGDASFAGGRPRNKSGDHFIQGRDGNFIRVHRGGVLQLGSSMVCQRIYLPIGNLIHDIAEEYTRNTAGGSVHMGVQLLRDSTGDLPTDNYQVYRVYAADKYADLRVRTGRVAEPAIERGGSLQLDEQQVVYEIALARDGFDEHTGAYVNQDARQSVLFRFAFDRTGGFLLRAGTNAYVRAKQRIFLEADERIDLKAPEVVIAASTKLSTSGPQADFANSQVGLGPAGSSRKPVARIGDTITILPPTPLTVAGKLNGVEYAGVLVVSTPIIGKITTGQPAVTA